MQVGFVVAGVQKGGTTSIYEYLRQHPQLGMSEIKETHFFDNESEFCGAFVDYERYHRFFQQRPSITLYGEATPIYTYWPDAIPRIFEYNSQMKIIVLLRNPTDRAWSAWRMEKNRGADSLSFSDAIRAEGSRMEETYPLPHRVYSYIDRGLYAEQIRRVQRYFGENALFLKSEYVFQQTEEAVNRIFRFLDIQVHPVDTRTAHLQGIAEQGPNAEDRGFLLDHFRDNVASVEALLGWDCSDWLSI
jgi:hypothetical protein